MCSRGGHGPCPVAQSPSGHSSTELSCSALGPRGPQGEGDTAGACAAPAGLCSLAKRPSSACSSHTATRERVPNTVTLKLVTCEVGTFPTQEEVTCGFIRTVYS